MYVTIWLGLKWTMQFSALHTIMAYITRRAKMINSCLKVALSFFCLLLQLDTLLHVSSILVTIADESRCCRLPYISKIHPSSGCLKTCVHFWISDLHVRFYFWCLFIYRWNRLTLTHISPTHSKFFKFNYATWMTLLLDILFNLSWKLSYNIPTANATLKFI